MKPEIDVWPEANRLFLETLQSSARGTKRDGVFAVWLTVRVALGVCMSPPLPERMARRRLAALERRISSLTLPPPLRRALTQALDDLREPTPETTARVLRQLIAPVGDVLGQGPRDAVSRVARAVGRWAKRSPSA